MLFEIVPKLVRVETRVLDTRCCCVTNEITIPTMLISYEKLLMNTRSVLSTICSFCGIPCKEEAIQSIIANDANYTSSIATGKAWLDDNH